MVLLGLTKVLQRSAVEQASLVLTVGAEISVVLVAGVVVSLVLTWSLLGDQGLVSELALVPQAAAAAEALVWKTQFAGE